MVEAIVFHMKTHSASPLWSNVGHLSSLTSIIFQPRSLENTHIVGILSFPSVDHLWSGMREMKETCSLWIIISLHHSLIFNDSYTPYYFSARFCGNNMLSSNVQDHGEMSTGLHSLSNSFLPHQLTKPENLSHRYERRFCWAYPANLFPCQFTNFKRKRLHAVHSRGVL